jgi:hypothetical protein
MKRTAIVVAALLAPLLLFGCTTPTPYQPLAAGTGVSGGYSDQVLDDTHFQVSFSGNDMTPRAQVETYLLYRAAELTTAKGFDWFEMVERHTQNTGGVYADPYFYGGWGYWSPSWRFRRRGGYWGGSWGGYWGDPWGPYAVDTYDKFDASAEIVVGRGPKPPGDPRAFDAHQVIQNLEAKIVRPGAPTAH